MSIPGWDIGVAEAGRAAREEKFTHLIVASTRCISSTIIYHLLGFLCTSHNADLFDTLPSLTFKTSQWIEHHYVHFMEVRNLSKTTYIVIIRDSIISQTSLRAEGIFLTIPF